MVVDSSVLWIIISCFSYCVVSVLMTITNKELLGSKRMEGFFSFPTSLVFFQNLTSVLFLRVAAGLGFLTLEPILVSRLKRWIPLNLLFIAMLTTGSFGLALLSVPMVVIFKNLQTAATVFGDWYYFQKAVSYGTISCLVLMITGAFVAGYNDLEYNFFGYFWVTLNCLFGAAYVLTTKLVIDDHKMDKLDNINYNCTLSLPFLFVIMIINGEFLSVLEWMTAIPTSPKFLILITSNFLFSFGISFTSFWVIQTTSPTTYGILGAVNKIPLTLASMWYFKDVYSTIGGWAIFGSLSGGIVYAYTSAISQGSNKSEKASPLSSLSDSFSEVMDSSPPWINKINLANFLQGNLRETETFCNAIYNHSFAILEIVDESEVQFIQETLDETMKFFLELEKEEKMATQVLFMEYQLNQGLVGYNTPSPSKEIFRIRRSSEKRATFWPANRPFFKEKNICLRDYLERIGTECVRHLLRDYCKNKGAILDGVVDHHSETNYLIEEEKFYPSPYDLFYYPNNESVANIANCTDHIDPGFITLIPCAPTPGLSIFNTKDGNWVEIENLLHPSRDLIVFPGKYLQSLTKSYFPGCAHRVEKAPHSRCSLVYEWRPRVEES